MMKPGCRFLYVFRSGLLVLWNSSLSLHWHVAFSDWFLLSCWFSQHVHSGYSLPEFGRSCSTGSGSVLKRFVLEWVTLFLFLWLVQARKSSVLHGGDWGKGFWSPSALLEFRFSWDSFLSNVKLAETVTEILPALKIVGSGVFNRSGSTRSWTKGKVLRLWKYTAAAQRQGCVTLRGVSFGGKPALLAEETGGGP